MSLVLRAIPESGYTVKLMDGYYNLFVRFREACFLGCLQVGHVQSLSHLPWAQALWFVFWQVIYPLKEIYPDSGEWSVQTPSIISDHSGYTPFLHYLALGEFLTSPPLPGETSSAGRDVHPCDLSLSRSGPTLPPARLGLVALMPTKS